MALLLGRVMASGYFCPGSLGPKPIVKYVAVGAGTVSEFCGAGDAGGEFGLATIFPMDIAIFTGCILCDIRHLALDCLNISEEARGTCKP